MSADRPTAETRDVIIVGGGHNGLVTAFYLAKAGFKPLVLERREQVGGASITEEFHPGFRCSTLSHNTGPLRADIVRDMQLERHGLKLTTPDVNTVSLLQDGRALVLYSDTKKAAQEIAQWSQKDAASYADFGTALGKIGKVIGEALLLTPPNIDSPNSGDLWGMLKTGRAIRNLGKKDLYRVLRWGPMAAADLVAAVALVVITHPALRGGGRRLQSDQIQIALNLDRHDYGFVIQRPEIRIRRCQH